ncbi:hypothetical protein ABZ816_35500 [Actinosynnema sp. NPDC047251]|uniref:Uncharacterized protein n=1 Tax=Saccharothrix espanaensis (strain ATCC 51144 / DSM 44229 / JCM 9112 / NBRC 15066 / NRRL 15764) TaxID=1179773 RepID=K0JTL6_SACES|nr:hypothetical protein [Saccharothrix espanaensis]CCH29276.1 hypothetical protein BN6_19570 [Saccharothrix espanaensis DSM 44229]
MPVFVVPKAHIDLLVTAALHYCLIDKPADADVTGAMLWSENYRSVNRYYREANKAPLYIATLTRFRYHPVAVLKAVDGYQHQILERPDSPPTRASAWCRALRAAVETELSPDDRAIVRGVTGTLVPAYQCFAVYARAPWRVESLDDVPLADRPMPR